MRASQNSSAARWVRLLCTQNPFYVISAALVLYGLRLVTADSLDLSGGWLAMGVICGYTLLLAAAAVLIVRVARVWDDARMILLVLVLLFLALSVSFDKIVLAAPLAGLPLLLSGLVFSMLLSEAVLRMLGVRLAGVYRLPYHLMLMLLFGYPLLLAWLSAEGFDRTLAWGVYLFPWLAGGAFLTLLPAASWGHRDERPNGTPWRWPLYPWSLFVGLWICFALRAYSVSFAFEAPRELNAQFAPHFLTPLILAAAVLLLEIGIRTRRPLVQKTAMLAPLGILPMALVDGGASHSLFATALRETAGSPIQIACWLLLAYYGIAWMRQVRVAEGALVAVLLLCSIVNIETVGIGSFCWPQPLAIQAAAVFMLAVGLVEKRKWQGAFGALLLLAASSSRDPQLVYTLATMHHGYFTIHLAILGVLLWAMLGRDPFSHGVRTTGFFVLPAAAALASLAYDTVYPEVPTVLHLMYILGLTLSAWGFWDRRQQTHDLAGAMATSLACALRPARHAYLLLHATILQKALPFMAAGLILLLLAILISLYKGGQLQQGWSALSRLNARMRRELSG